MVSHLSIAAAETARSISHRIAFERVMVGVRYAYRFVREEDGALRLIGVLGSPPPGSGTITFDITLPRAPADLVAPCGVFLRAANISGAQYANGDPISEPPGNDNVYDPTQHYITFAWFLPDEGYVPLHTPNTPTAWRDRTRAYGKQISCVLTAPGDKTITSFAYDERGNWGFATYVFGAGGQSGPILSRAAVYPANTVISLRVDASGDFSGAFPGSTQVTGVANLRAAMQAIWGAGRRNICVELRAGDEFLDPVNMFENLSSGLNGNPRDNLKGLYITRFGVGPNPIIRYFTRDTTGVTTPDRSDLRQVIIDNIQFRGRWDPTTELELPWSQAFSFAATCPCLVHRCTITKLGSVGSSGISAPGSVILSDISGSDWANYSVPFPGPGFFAMLDFDIAQNPDALCGVDQIALGGQQSTELGNRHAFRWSYVFDTYIARGSFFFRGGWSQNGDTSYTTNPATEEQGHRGFTWFDDTGPTGPNFNERRHHHFWDRVATEGAGMGLGVTVIRVNSNSSFNPKNFVIDKMLYVATAMNRRFLGSSMGGVTIRNSYFRRFDIPAQGWGLFDSDVDFTPQGAFSPGTLPMVRIYNNTFINDGPASTVGNPHFGVKIDAAFQSEVANNVVVIPTRSVGGAFAPLGVSALAGVVTRSKPLRWNFPPIGSVGGTIPPTVGTLRFNETGTAGPVAPGEWMAIPWPNFSGLCNGAGMADVRAAVLANATQNHMMSVAVNGQSQFFHLGPLKGGAVFDTSNPTFLRIQNTSAVTWPATSSAWILLDLRDSLMPGKTGTGTEGRTVNAPIPGTGSAARAAPSGVRAYDHFLGEIQNGQKDSAGNLVSRTQVIGAFAA
jgi:hypothetical protein